MNDEQAIHEVIETWMSATKAGDSEAVLSLMTDDVVFMVPGQEPFGKESFATASQEMTGMHIDGKAEIKELKIFGEWAFARTYLEVTMTPEGGEPMRRTGYTLTILHKESDGKWRLARDANLLAGTH